MKYPIFIPSKGRVGITKTTELLSRENIPFKVVVEPQEYDEYRKVFTEEQLLCLDRNNGKLGYSRHFIKNYAKNNGYEYHWQIDDNIPNFRIRENGSNIKQPASLVLKPIEDYVERFDNVGICGLRHSVFAWTMNDEYTYNNQCVSCVLVKSDTKSNYRFDPPIVEDTDFTLQILYEGYSTIIFNRHIFDKPAQGKLKGGCSTDYNSGGHTSLQQELIRRWRGAFELAPGKNKTRIKPSKIWKQFQQRPIAK